MTQPALQGGRLDEQSTDRELAVRYRGRDDGELVDRLDDARDDEPAGATSSEARPHRRQVLSGELDVEPGRTVVGQQASAQLIEIDDRVRLPSAPQHLTDLLGERGLARSGGT